MSGRKDAKNYKRGHGARLWACYWQNAETPLQDYELLELLLAFAIPRRDTKAAAHSRSGTA
jgi:DNA repair protein RadC